MIAPRLAPAALAFVLLANCAKRSTDAVEDLGNSGDARGLELKSLGGGRDGERLTVRALYADGPRTLAVNLRFTVNPQAHLQSGTWAGFGLQGSVQERSSTFLGGQAGAPSFGGRFDLLGSDGRARYRIAIPLQPLQQINE